MIARTLATLTASAAVLALATQSADAAITAKTSIATSAGGTRIVVVLNSSKAVARRARPTSVTLVVKGRSYKLSRAAASAAAVKLGTWRSKAYKGAAAQKVAAIAGAAAKLKLRTAAGTKTLATQVAVPGGPGDSTLVTGDAPLFAVPALPSTGNAAFEAIKGYLADSSFTDCPAGWPNCAVEERYSHFANGDHYYCRLTPTSGSDIKSYGSIQRISGAEQNADGSWGVEYYLSSYGNTTFYSWHVAANGAVTGRYWGPGRDPTTGPANQELTGLQWMRGAKDCSY